MQVSRPTELAFSTIDKSCISVFPKNSYPWIKVNDKKYIWKDENKLSPHFVFFLTKYKMLFTV